MVSKTTNNHYPVLPFINVTVNHSSMQKIVTDLHDNWDI